MALDTVLPSVPIWTAYLAVAVGGVAGASHAARRGFDVIGVLGLAAATGLGGLLLRDVLIQRGTPVVLTDPRYLLAASFAALLGFFFAGLIARFNRVLVTLDALAMGLFVALGASAALFFSLGIFPAIFLGLVTAIGGNILRDILSGESPAVLRPGIFAGVAALIGAIAFVVLFQLGLPTFWNQLATIATVFIVRVLAVVRGWESPTPVDMSRRLSRVLSYARVTPRQSDAKESEGETAARAVDASEPELPAPAAIRNDGEKL